MPIYARANGSIGLRLVVAGVACLVTSLTATTAEGQLFGGMSDASAVDEGLGAPTGRFVRGSRGRRGFIGSNRNRRTFVGSAQSSRTTITPVRQRPPVTDPDRAAASSVNRRRTASSANSNYEPPLQIAFEAPARSAETVTATINRTLRRIDISSDVSRIAVNVQGQTAILSGSVPTEHARWLIEQIVRMEPGVDAVSNAIAVEESPSSRDR